MEETATDDDVDVVVLAGTSMVVVDEVDVAVLVDELVDVDEVSTGRTRSSSAALASLPPQPTANRVSTVSAMRRHFTMQTEGTCGARR